MDTYNIERFIAAQNKCYKTVKNELLNERKLTHWMWFIFPQLKSLGMSDISVYYGIKDILEAKSYLENKILKDRMYELCNILLNASMNNPIKIFGDTDSKKLRSSMTLFYLASGEDIFKNVLDKFFDGKLDQITQKIILK